MRSLIICVVPSRMQDVEQFEAPSSVLNFSVGDTIAALPANS